MSSMIQPVSGSISAAARSPAAIAGAKGTPEVQRMGDEVRERSAKPVTDEYIPEKKQEPAGRYWLGKGEDGQPKIYFDDPEKKASGDKAERCTGSTDQVDREIERLKKKREELERQINAQTDEAKIRELKQKLAQVESELSQKDNDAYRRRHTVFS